MEGVASTSWQQIHCIKNKVGAIVGCADDDIGRVHVYTRAFNMHSSTTGNKHTVYLMAARTFTVLLLSLSVVAALYGLQS